MSERNSELFDKIAAQIEEEPYRYDQTGWDVALEEDDDGVCGTAHCVAGWAIMLTYGAGWFRRYGKEDVPVPDGFNRDEISISSVAAHLLGLDAKEHASLFAASWAPKGYHIEDNPPPVGVVADTLRDIGRGGDIPWPS